MENKAHTFSLTLDWELIRLNSQIDRFDASGLGTPMPVNATKTVSHL